MPYDSIALVNEGTAFLASQQLGKSLKQARRSAGFTQRQLAVSAKLDIATVQSLEQGRGSTTSLFAVLGALKCRFMGQPHNVDLGPWIASARKSARHSQSSLSAKAGLSKPTIIQVEHGRGNLTSLLRIMEALGVPATVAPAVADDAIQLFLGDCLELLPTIPADSVDAIIADLPYSTTRLDWDQSIPLAPLWEQFRRVLKPNGAVILTASQPFTSELVMSNPDWFKYALVWLKTRPTGFLNAKNMPMKKHEDICVFAPGTVIGRRSNRQMTYNPQELVPLDRPKSRRNGLTEGTFIGRQIGNPTVQTHTNYPSSVLRFPSEAKPIHPVQKPVDLFRYLVRTFTNEGETVLDCCFGSGTTGVAALMEGRRFIGIEREEQHFEIGKRRIRRTQAQGLATVDSDSP